MSFSLRNFLEEAAAQVNPFDNGKTAATVRASRPAPPAVTPSQNATSAPSPSVGDRARHIGTGIGLGGLRSFTGLGQGLSGLYDLASPGKGTNRFSKKLDKLARETDATAKAENIATPLYKGSQLGTEALTFAAGAAGAKLAGYAGKGLPMVTKTAKFTEPVSSAIGKVTTNLASRGVGGRIAAQTIKGAVNPANNVANVAMTAKYTGEEASKGRDISPGSVATNLAAGTAFNVGLPAAGAVIKEAVRPTTNLIKNRGLVRPSNLTDQELTHLQNFRNTAGTGQIMDDATYANGVNAAQKAGIDYRNPSQIDDVLGAHRTFDTRLQQRNQKLQNVKERLAPTALDTSGGGGLADTSGEQFIKNPITGETIPNPKYQAPTLTQGQRVRASDRGNIGTVSNVNDDGSVRVTFTNRKDKTTFTKTMQPHEIKPLASSKTALEPSSSSLRNSDQRTTTQTLPTEKSLKESPNSQNSMLDQPSPNLTTKTREVKLNTDRLNPDGGYAALSEMQQATTERVNQLSNKEIESVAKSAGIDTKTHSDEQIRKKIAEQLNVRQDAVRYMNEAEIARKSGDIELAKQLLLKAAEQGRISRAQGSELAQQLQARRIIANELDTPQQRVFKLLDAAGVNPEAYVNRFAEVDFNNPKQVMEAYRDLVPPTAAQWLDTVRYNSMLSSPLTQMVNIFGNAQNVALVAPIEKTVRGVFDAIGGAFGKERRYAAGEGLAFTKGAATNIANGARAFRDALRGTGKYANPDFEEYSVPLATKGLSGATYKTLSAPMRVLDGMDKFFRAIAGAGEEAALDLRIKKGIDIRGDKQSLMDKEAAYRVFQQDLHEPGQGVLADASDSFASIVMSGRNSKNPIVSTISKFTVPFVKTINNINKQGMIEFTPLGYVNMKGNTDKVTAFTRATMGTAIFGISALLISGDKMTWAEPRNAEERARFRSEGKQPYAVNINGKWVGFSKLTPAIAFPMAMTAALNDALKSKTIDQSNVDAILEAVSKFGNFLSDQSYAKSVGDTLGAIGGDKEAVAQVVSNNIQQVVPFRALTGWVARMGDTVERRIDVGQSYFDQQVQSLMQQYPGLRQKTPTRDYKGEPIPANNAIFNGISPVRVTTDRGVDPIDAAKDKADKLKDNSESIPPSMKLNYEKFLNKKIKDAQNELIQTPQYKGLDDKDKGKALDTLKTKYTSAYKRQFMADNGIPIKDEASKTDEKILTGNTSVTDLVKSRKEKSTDYYKSPDAEYNDALKRYKDDEKDLSDAQKITRGKELEKLRVTSTFNKEIRDLYGLSKADLADYLAKEEPGKDKKALADQLFALDQSLKDAGLIKDKKFKYGIAPSTSKGSGGKKGRKGSGKGKLSKGYKLYAFNSAPNNSSLRNIVKKTTVKARKK